MKSRRNEVEDFVCTRFIEHDIMFVSEPIRKRVRMLGVIFVPYYFFRKKQERDGGKC